MHNPRPAAGVVGSDNRGFVCLRDRKRALTIRLWLQHGDAIDDLADREVLRTPGHAAFCLPPDRRRQVDGVGSPDPCSRESARACRAVGKSALPQRRSLARRRSGPWHRRPRRLPPGPPRACRLRHREACHDRQPVLLSSSERLAGRVDPPLAPRSEATTGKRWKQRGSGTAGPALVLHGSPVPGIPRRCTGQFSDARFASVFLDPIERLDLERCDLTDLPGRA